MKEIEEFNPSVRLLDKECKILTDKFISGERYPEYGIGEYVRKEAYEDLETGSGTTYVVVNTVNKYEEMVAFYTLSSTAIPYCDRIKEDDGTYDIGFCGIPAVELNAFAVSLDYQDTYYKGQLVSSLVFKNIIAYIDQLSKTTLGIKALMLHPVESAKKFYSRNNMLDYPDNMILFDSADSSLGGMYVFLRDVEMIYEE